MRKEREREREREKQCVRERERQTERERVREGGRKRERAIQSESAREREGKLEKESDKDEQTLVTVGQQTQQGSAVPPLTLTLGARMALSESSGSLTSPLNPHHPLLDRPHPPTPDPATHQHPPLCPTLG